MCELLFGNKSVVVFSVDVDGELLHIVGGGCLGDSSHFIDENEPFDLELLDIVDLFRSNHENTCLGPVEHVNLFNVICEQEGL
jgi:hypothetical protein